MSYAEAYRMLDILLGDPSSYLGAAAAGWQYPASRAELTLRDIYDMEHGVAVAQGGSKKKPKPYPRPWDDAPKKIGAGVSVTVAEFRAIKADLFPRRPRDARGRFVKVS